MFGKIYFLGVYKYCLFLVFCFDLNVYVWEFLYLCEIFLMVGGFVFFCVQIFLI